MGVVPVASALVVVPEVNPRSCKNDKRTDFVGLLYLGQEVKDLQDDFCLLKLLTLCSLYHCRGEGRMEGGGGGGEEEGGIEGGEGGREGGEGGREGGGGGEEEGGIEGGEGLVEESDIMPH